MDIKDLIIFLIIFIAVLWLQHNDDKKFNKPNRIALFDKIKLPLFISVAILLIKNLYNTDTFLNFTNQSNTSPVTSSTILQPVNFNDVFTEQPDF
jgi:hypothetical protein